MPSNHGFHRPLATTPEGVTTGVNNAYQDFTK